MFTGAPELGKRMGIRSHKQYAFWNGALPCKLLLFKVQPDQFVTGERRPAEPDAGAAQRPAAVASEPARLSEGAQMFANRLQKNLKQLGKWARREQVDCYRLYDADMPEYALAVDLYQDWVHVQEYAAPRSVDPTRLKRVCSMPWPPSRRPWVSTHSVWCSSAGSARVGRVSTSAKVPKAASVR